MNIYALLGLSILAGGLYHLGGQWQKMFRRAGLPILCYIPALLILFGLSGWILYILSAGLLSLALTTYHDYLSPDGKRETWLCWLVTGLCYGLASLPLIWAGINWYAIIGRAIVLAGLTTWISERSGKVLTEEFWRGAIILLTIPILKI